MPLPSSGNITLQQIQSEYSTSGLQASSTAAGLDPLPTAMRDFLGLSNYVLTQQDVSLTLSFYEGYVEGGYSQAFAQHSYTRTGVLEYVAGGNSAYMPWTVETDYWVNSTPNGGNRASIAANYDFEWEFVSGDNTNIDWQGLPHAYSRTITVTPAYGVRVNMASNDPTISVTVDTFGSTISAAYIQYRSKFYTAGTNNLVSSTLHTIDLSAQNSGMA